MLKPFRDLQTLACLLAIVLSTLRTTAGGGPLNTVVVVNANSTNSLELGNYYCEQRGIPPQNVVRINWAGGNVAWTLDQFQSVLLQPLNTALAQRQIAGQIHYVVLSMDIPFQIQSGSMINSTTAALFYGFKGPNDLKTAGNSYAFSEAPYELLRPGPRTNWLATMLTAGSLAQAKALVDQGRAADNSFPAQRIVLAKTADPLRNLRHRSFDSTIFGASIDGRATIVRTNSAAFPDNRPLLGWQTGLTVFTAPRGSFVPGAIADSMTSFGGIIFGPNSQTTLLELIHAGATASYGTVAEPSADVAKFPDPVVYFYQSRGFNVAESYYQSVSVPYLGLIVGDPLAAPFGKPAQAQWRDIAAGQTLSGTRSFGLDVTSDPQRPIQQIDLFVDGVFFRSLTNVPPTPGNQLAAFMHGRHMNHTVLANETLSSLAAGLAARVNQPPNTNLTGIAAIPFGDRVVLTRFTTNVPARPPAPTNLRTPDSPTGQNGSENGRLSFANHAGPAGVATSFLNPSDTRFVPSGAHGMRTFSIGGSVDAGSWLKLTLPRSNAPAISVTTSNQSNAANALALANAFAAAINSDPELQAADGVAVEDVTAGWFGSAALTLRARQPGIEPSATRVQISGASSLVITPAEETALDQNVGDLLPRNHVYVTAGSSNINLALALDTTALIDGYHELTAIAYEGSHVRTQTRASVPVQVQNTELQAALSFSASTNVVAVSGQYQITVTANAPIASVSLATTGGVLATQPGPGAVEFNVSGATLGSGLHPFHAIVTSTAGDRFRTPPLWIRFLPH